MTSITKQELDKYEAFVRRIPAVQAEFASIPIYFPNARFRKLLDPFFDVAKLLIDYAYSQGWYDLSDYYKLIETPTPDTGHQEYIYLFEHHTQFLDIIARYRIEKNLV
ncbi:hypothetical protein [Spirosoma luteum]|uniref:hypothetical protein n=1 Tax=Spirosoma luteum TaxID=431553 RepID=UPI00038116B5|nr:hypothetical protein [Spirosoma luteum]